jgi:hypothetical protein
MKKFTLLLIICFPLIACGGGDSNINSVSSNPTGSKSIAVRWDIPASRVNGAVLSLSAIGGYKIFVTTDSNSIPQTPHTTINDASTTSLTLNDLSSATYYIYIITFDVNGDDSPYSDAISKTL